MNILDSGVPRQSAEVKFKEMNLLNTCSRRRRR